MYNIACSITSLIIICFVAPVEAPNKPLSSIKRIQYKKISVAIAFMFLSFAIMTIYTHILPNITIYAFTGELAAVLTMIAGIKKSNFDMIHNK